MKRQESTGCGEHLIISFLVNSLRQKENFIKTIVAGHVGTGSWSLADNRNYHDVFTMEKVITILMARFI